MDTKGDVEEMTYPYVCFMVDNFDEVWMTPIYQNTLLRKTNHSGIQ